jgi:replication factor C small subunit
MIDYEVLIEKYRPKKLDEVIGQYEIIKRLKKYVERKNVPNLLLTGPRGSAKTASAHCIARELFKDDFSLNFKEFNASDERGINTVRDKIKDYANVKSIGDVKFKIILLDEAESLTSDAQNALKRTLEIYTNSCRFILTCNYSSKIIEPLQSRCAIYRFKKLSPQNIMKICKNVCDKESIQVQQEVLESIAYVSDGDARRAIGIIETARLTSESNIITIDDIYQVASLIDKKTIIDIIKTALSGNFVSARIMIDDLLIDGLSSLDIIKQTMDRVEDMSIDDKTKIELICIIGEAHWRISEGEDDAIGLHHMIANIAQLGSLI